MLVVEDRPDVRETHGAEIDLVLTDLVIPRMTGRELAGKLRVLRPEVRVLYMSGYPDDLAVLNGSSADSDQLIAKPFSPQQLATRIAGIL